MINISRGPVKLIALCMLSLASVTAFNGCSDDEEPAPAAGQGANEVWMQNTVFSPGTRTVAVNTTVTWTNKDNFDHNVVSDSGLFNSGIIAAGATYSRTFSTAG